jgi:hypothetical protein
MDEQGPLFDPASDPAGTLNRREVLLGIAATGVVVGSSQYASPVLKALGRTSSQALVSRTPAPGGGNSGGNNVGKRCGPDFWSNAGDDLWDERDSEHWNEHGGKDANPFTHDTTFNSYFARLPELDGMTMLEIANGPGNTPGKRAARELIAAYLNSSFGPGYPYAAWLLRTMWSTAKDRGQHALLNLGAILENVNSNCVD